MPISKVGSVWINPLSTSPADLVNRTREREKLLGRLEEYLDADSPEARILVTGDRGVGKSILTRAVLEEFAAQHQDRVVLILVKGRGVDYRDFLKAFALDLARLVRPYAGRWTGRGLGRWLDELTELAQVAQITRSQTDSTGSKVGVGTDFNVGSDLVAKLAAKFSLEATRSLGVTKQVALTVTDEVLHEAIMHTLERLRTATTPLTVVVFYDDLDQAFSSGQGDVEAGMQRVMELQPCIAVAHIRSESLSANVRRVITDEVMVDPLPREELVSILRKRVSVAKRDEVREAFAEPGRYGPFEQLAAITGNALAFLRWSKAMLVLWGAEVPTDWHSDRNLREIALEATPIGGIDAKILVELAHLVDACALKDHGDGCRFDDLVRGAPASCVAPTSPPLTRNELTQLESLGLLLKRNQFAERPVYRIEPTLDLLRPSIAAKLRQTA